MPIEPFEIYAIRYAHLGNRHAAESFIFADPHEQGPDLDYFVWIVRRKDCVFVVDTGFAEEAAQRRKRELLRSPAETLRMLEIDAAQVKDVIITHLHYDHAGTLNRFPRARFHLQDREMNFATGRLMAHKIMRIPFDVDDVLNMVRCVYANRVAFHDGDEELMPGLSLHRVGGHSAGLQIVRVWTRRGWVVLASDAAHHYANFEKRRPFPIVYNVAEMLEGYNLLYRLAESADHIIPGHDALVMSNYPAASPESDGIIARLDMPPNARLI